MFWRAFVFLILGFSLFSLGCSTFGLSDKTQIQQTIVEPINAYEPLGVGKDSRGELVSPSLKNRRKNWKKSYIHRVGYLRRPAFFPNQEEATKFQRCEPFKILSFEKRKNSNEYVMIIKQKNKTIRINSVNRKNLKLNSEQSMAQLDQHFVDRLLFLDQERHPASVAQHLCVGKLWENMSKDYFLFVSGQPDEIRPGTGKYKGVEQWIYKSHKGRKQHSYYFTNNTLWKWTD